MRRGAIEQRFAPCFEPRKLFYMAKSFDPVEKGITLQEGSVDDPFFRLARTQREGAAQGLHLCVGGNVEKTAGEPEILEKRPKIIIPRIAVERKIPELME